MADDAGLDREGSESLSDYLGHLLSSVSKARMQADLETIRLAEIYKKHPLLQHFPVPRVRLPKVELNVPVVMVGTLTPDDEPNDDGSNTPQTEEDRIANGMVSIFDELVREAGGVPLSADLSTDIAQEAKVLVSKLNSLPGMKKPSRPEPPEVKTDSGRGIFRPRPDEVRKPPKPGEQPAKANPESPLSLKKLMRPLLTKGKMGAFASDSTDSAKYLAHQFFDLASVKAHLSGQKLGDDKSTDVIKKTFTGQLRDLLLYRQAHTASRLLIRPETAKVREVNSTEHLSYFKLYITEDSVEWTESEGWDDVEKKSIKQDILVPE